MDRGHGLNTEISLLLPRPASPGECAMNRMELDVTSQVVDDQHVISVKGEIDLYTSTTLREYIFTTLKHQPRALIVNLDAVRYMDSSGIATMVEALQRANKSNIPFKVAGLSNNVLEVFELVKLEKVFDIYDSLDEALKRE
jgi:anti-sigma B factor antagonist